MLLLGERGRGMQYEAKDVYEAVNLAFSLKDQGQCDLFRGQANANWPVVSSLLRLTDVARKDAIERFNLFHSWLTWEQSHSEIPADEDAALAIAQHYGLKTPLIDFTKSPHVAAFFASDFAPSDGYSHGKIVLLNSSELHDLTELVSNTPGFEDVKDCLRVVDCKVPGLWRLDAQEGMFLEARVDPSTLSFFWHFDEIVFPHTESYAFVTKEMIYPARKSEIELHLDSFFTWECTHRRSLLFRELIDTLPPQNVLYAKAEMDGELLQHDLADHASWPAAGAWSANRGAIWQGHVVRILDLSVPNQGRFEGVIASTMERIRAFKPASVLDYGVTMRTRRPLWTEMVQTFVEGVRYYQYREEDVQNGLALLVALCTCFDGDRSEKNQHLQSIGFLEIEMGTTSGVSERAYCAPDQLSKTVRPDLDRYIRDATCLSGNLTNLLLACPFPRKLFDFEAFSSLYCRQILPTQIFLERAPLFNPIALNTFGIP